MDRTQYLTDDIVQDAIGKRHVTMGDAIALAEARVYHELGDDILIIDCRAKRLVNSDGWAVTLTVQPDGPDFRG